MDLVPSKQLVPITLFALAGAAEAGHGSNELSLDAESSSLTEGYGASIGYAHRVRPEMLVGAGAGVGWSEEQHSFETNGQKTNLFYTVHGEGFARFEPFSYLHFDTGVTAMSFTTTDDDPSRTTFVGVYASASVGYAPIFVSTRVRMGRAGGDVDQFGAVYTPVTVRAVFDW